MLSSENDWVGTVINHVKQVVASDHLEIFSNDIISQIDSCDCSLSSSSLDIDLGCLLVKIEQNILASTFPRDSRDVVCEDYQPSIAIRVIRLDISVTNITLSDLFFVNREAITSGKEVEEPYPPAASDATPSSPCCEVEHSPEASRKTERILNIAPLSSTEPRSATLEDVERAIVANIGEGCQS